MLQNWADHYKWPIRPLGATGPKGWVIGCATEPPSSQMVFNGNPILVRKLELLDRPRILSNMMSDRRNLLQIHGQPGKDLDLRQTYPEQPKDLKKQNFLNKMIGFTSWNKHWSKFRLLSKTNPTKSSSCTKKPSSEKLPRSNISTFVFSRYVRN